MPTVDVHVRAAGKTDIMSIDLAEGGFNVIVHGQGMRVDIPTYVDISCRTTIPCMENFTQGEWEWVSQGDLFQGAWKEAFDRSWSGGKVVNWCQRNPH